MAIDLNTLTSPATSGDVLAEALTTADFLEPVPVLRNLARGSQKGGDAKQDTALNQPKALPLIKNPSGNLGGYLYIPDVAGNYAEGPSVTIGANQTWEAEVDMVITQFGTSSPFKYVIPFGTQGGWNSGIGFWIDHNANVVAWSKGRYTNTASGITLNTPFNIKYGFDGTNVFYKINDVVKGSTSGNDQSAVLTAVLQLNQQTLNRVGNYAIQKAKLTVNNAVVFDCDFNGSTSIRHGDTKFNCVGGPVSLTRAGQDPITVVKKGVLRFDGVNDGLRGLFNQTIDGGYMFAAFSVLGTGGGGNDNRVFSVNANGAGDVASNGFVYGLKYGGSPSLASYGAGAYLWAHNGMYDDDRGDILYEAKAKSGGLITKVNNANKFQPTTTLAIASNEFNVGNGINYDRPAAIDLEYLAVFPATITDAEADSVRNYINKRNNVFDLKDGFGYYFFDPQKATFTGNFTNFGGGNILNGYITGSDNGDTDVRSNLTLIQETQNDQPQTDGYTITFNDAAEHLEFKNGVSQNLSGWQIVGTSLGTFAYRVDNDAVTELNLLGNAGSHRSVGDSFGMLLLPESATGADIEQARKLLIDRGAADGPVSSSLFQYWFGRDDIVEFKHINTSSVTSARAAWLNNYSLEVFPALDLRNSNSFVQTWQNSYDLTSFPADAKLGTSAQNVNFTSAWQSSGLTSFPALDLSKGNNFNFAFNGCSALASFPSGAKLGTSASNVQFLDTWKLTGLTTFPADIDLSKGTYFRSAWRQSALTSFPAIESLRNGADFSNGWLSCTSLTDFGDVFTNWNPASISSGVFGGSWGGCSALTAQSVENILTSIDASGKYATSTGASGGSALADAGIDIDYNTATGSLSAATNTAVTSLKAKGWSIIVNNVTL